MVNPLVMLCTPSALRAPHPCIVCKGGWRCCVCCLILFWTRGQPTCVIHFRFPPRAKKNAKNGHPAMGRLDIPPITKSQCYLHKMDLSEALTNAFYVLEEERVRPTLSYHCVAKEWPPDMAYEAMTMGQQGYTPAMASSSFLHRERQKRPRTVRENPSEFQFTSVNFNLLLAILNQLAAPQRGLAQAFDFDGSTEVAPPFPRLSREGGLSASSFARQFVSASGSRARAYPTPVR